MKPIKYFSVGLFALCSLFMACGEDAAPTVAEVKKETAAPTNPFQFYKNVEIRPGINFEIVSWGKGPDSVGGYSIFMSDSLHNNYKALSADRKGLFKDAYNLDLDTDGNPEFYIELVNNANAADLIVYEFDDNDFRKISFPALSAKTKKIFAGNDKFFIKNGELFRSIPVKDETDATGKKTVVKTVKYLLRGNSFEIKDVD